MGWNVWHIRGPFHYSGIQPVSSVALTADLHCYTVPTTSQSSASLVKFLLLANLSINGQISVAATQFLHRKPQSSQDRM